MNVETSTRLGMKETTKSVLYKFFDWIIKMVGYSLILVITAKIFDNTLYVDSSYYGFWCFLTSVLIFLLNKTVKPLLVWLTIPITGMTLGLFYPFINLFILKIVSFILGPHFVIEGLWFALFASILISVLNVLMDTFIFRKFNEKGR